MKYQLLSTAQGPLMSRVRMTLPILALLLCAATSAWAQSINIYGVNTANFPQIVADYVAFDATGNPITDLKASDFRVTETMQGGAPLDVTPTVTHDCKELTTDPESSILLILDVSTSMQDIVPGGNKKRIEYAKDALKAFVAKVKFTGNTRVALVTFAGAYTLSVDWTNNPQIIIDSLNKIKNPVGSTNYVLPFESTQGFNIYDLFQKRPSNIPRYAFFLTDGHPSPDINDASSTKSETKFVNDNVAKMNGMGIRFFSITILEPTTHWTLEALSKGTGGKSICTDESKLVDFMQYLALETQIKKVCQIKWVSPFSCNAQGQSRTATIAMIRGSNPTATVQYITPPNSVAKVDISDPVLFCGDPAPGQSFFANVTITAQGSTFTANGFQINPSTYFKIVDWNYPANQTTFSPFNLPVGGKRVLRVQFTQGPMQSFRQAQLTFTGGPCPPNITLVGGTGIILLQSPVGGELTSTCDTVVVKWAGVLPTQPVKIEYSADAGSTWNVVSAAATGLQYKWLPPAAGVNYKVRVSVAPVPQYVWAKQIGGAGQDTATSVAVTSSGLKVFITGYFDGATKIGPVTQPSASGNIDSYFAELDSDGNITTPAKVTLLTGSASNEEKIIGCVTDRNGNYYIAGYFTSPAANFGSFPLMRLNARDTKNMFIFKYDSTGALAWNVLSKGTSTQSSTANALDIGLRYNGSGNPEVVVYGKFQKYVEFGPNRAGVIEKSLSYANSTDRDYYVIFDNAGYPTFSLGVPPTSFVMKAKKVTDALGFTYETDHYKGPKTFTPPPVTLPNAGGTDVFVYKYGASPASSDESKKVFSVKSPTLSFTIAKASFAQVPQGDSTQSAFAGVLKNTGDFDVTIKSVKIVGANSNDFKMISNIVGQRLAAGKSFSVEMMFRPTGTGLRTALLEVIGDCNAQAQLLLEGDASAPCVWERQPTVNLGKVPLSQPRPFTITCVLKNTGPLNLSGNMTVVSSDPEIVVKNTGPFTLTPGQCFDVQVDVTAATAGVKTARVNFGLSKECGDAASAFTVEIVEPRVIIDSVNFGRVRVLTPVTDTISVSNLNTEEAEITSITIVDPTNPHFVFTPAAPQKLAPGAVVRIPVVFTPQTRGQLAATVRVIIRGKESTPLIGEAKGVGVLPSIAATGYTFTPWTVNTQSPDMNGKVIIRNLDSDQSLTISDVSFVAADPSFTWTTPLPTFPVVLAPGSAPLELPITFTPAKIGNNVVNVKISHDAKTGPGPVPPYADTIVVVQGIGKDQSSIDPIVFARTLTCATRTATFVIENPSFIYDLNCQTPVISGDAAVISIDQATGFTLKPGEKKIITVTFQPQTVGNFSAVVSIANDQNLKLNVSISGEGITVPVQFRFTQTPSATVGQRIQLPVSVSYNAADFNGAPPTTFQLTFTHDPDNIRFNSFVTPQATGWTFTPTISNGKLDVSAVSVGQPLPQGDFVTPSFDVFLNKDAKVPVDMKVTTPLSCLVVSGDVADVQMKFVCFSAGRLIDFSRSSTGIVRPKNNPVRDVLEFEYSTGIPAPSNIQIINAMGVVVAETSSAIVPAGVYEYTADVSSLSNGAYFLRLISGNQVATTTFNIVR